MLIVDEGLFLVQGFDVFGRLEQKRVELLGQRDVVLEESRLQNVPVTVELLKNRNVFLSAGFPTIRVFSEQLKDTLTDQHLYFSELGH